jgi:hypothetical protein
MGRDVARVGTKINAYIILDEKTEGKRSFGRPRRRWEDITIELREIGVGVCGNFLTLWLFDVLFSQENVNRIGYING